MILLKNDFKTIQIALYFTNYDHKDTRVYRFLLPKLITSHTNQFDNKTKMNQQLEAPYNAYFKTRVERIGNLNVLSIILTLVDPKIVKDVKLLGQCIDLMKEMIQEDRVFNLDIFEEEKRMLIEQWETIKDKKRLYAHTKFNQYFFEKDPYGEPLSGKLRAIKSTNLEALEMNFSHLLKNDSKQIIVNGNLTSDDLAMIKNAFDFKTIPLTLETKFRAPRLLKKIYEATEMQQAILKLGYHFPIFRNNALFDAAVVAEIIIGGYPESRLFKEIRETLGLCYDISSSYEYYKGVLMISSGVDESKKEQALEKIQEIMTDLSINGITDNELDQAKSYYIHQIKSSLDQQSVLTKRAFVRELLNYNETIEDKLNMIQAITSFDVNLVLSKLTVDTIYVLHGGSDDKKTI